jgi:hypothetical protein
VKSEWAKKEGEYQNEQKSKAETRKHLDEKLKEAEQDFQEASTFIYISHSE